MRFDNETIEYISGKKFSNGANILISKKNEPLCNRFQIIESLCINKTVIHLGCVDHLPLINKKIKQKNKIIIGIPNLLEVSILSILESRSL